MVPLAPLARAPIPTAGEPPVLASGDGKLMFSCVPDVADSNRLYVPPFTLTPDTVATPGDVAFPQVTENPVSTYAAEGRNACTAAPAANAFDTAITDAPVAPVAGTCRK